VIKQCLALKSIPHFLLQTRPDRSGSHREEIAVHHIRISDSASPFPTTPQDTLHTLPYFSRALSEAISDAIVVTDTCGVVVDVNQNMVEITGYPRSEIIGTNWFDFFPNTVPASIEFALALRQNRVSNIELVIKSRGGKDIMVIYDEAPIYDCKSNLVGVLATLSDVTELHRLKHESFSGIGKK
jgi:PAS domain S-box-containing protein